MPVTATPKNVDKPVIWIKHNSTKVKIPLSDIKYIESANNKVIFNTLNGIFEDYKKISDMENMLNSTFFRVHRCYIVNLKFITGYKSSLVVINNETEIPLSRRKYSNFSSVLTAYMKSTAVR